MGSTARDAVRNRAQQQRGGGGSQAPAARGIIDTLNSEATQEQLALALPPGLSIDRFLRTTRTAIQLDHKLAECDVKSTIAAVHRAATLGLEPNVGQQCYLLPYNKKCQFILGYRGIITLARRSGLIAELYARPVYRNEEFDADYGLDGRLVHKPLVDAGAEQLDPETGEVLRDATGKAIVVERGPLRCFYGVAKFQDHAGNPAGHYWIVVPLTTIYEHREASSGWTAFQAKAIKDTPWNSNFEAMALKTVIRIMEPQLPLTPEVAHAVQNDDTWQPDVGREEHQPGGIIDTGLADDGEPGPTGDDLDDAQGAEPPGEPDATDPPAPEPGSQDPDDAAKGEQGQLVEGGEDKPPATPPKKAAQPAKAAAKKQAAQTKVAPPRDGDKVQPVTGDGYCPECELIGQHTDDCPNNPKNSGRRSG